MTFFSIAWFIEGFLHPLQNPSHLILLFAIGILIAQQHRGLILPVFLTFMVSILVGFLLLRNFTFEAQNILVILTVSFLVGILIIIKKPIPKSLLFTLAIVSGIFLGLDSSPIVIPGINNSSIYNWLFGTFASLVNAVVIISTISILLARFFQGMILRIIGSWISTSAIFILTLLLTKAN